MMALLVVMLGLGAAVPRAGAVAVLYAEVSEQLASEYAEASCAREKPECEWAYGGRCRQQGKFQATCWAVKNFRVERPDGPDEYWECKRHIRYTAEKRPWYRHKKVVKHRRFLAPWTCEPHHMVKEY
jgi:hypothetical protein